MSPFPACCYRQSLLANTDLQHGACRCAGMRYASSIDGDFLFAYREENATMCRSRVLSGRSVHARSVRRTREELAVFGGAPCECRSSASVQSEAARSSSIIMHAGGLEGPWVHGFERVAMAAARKEPKHSAEYILSTGVVFSQYLTILSHVCRLNTLLCRRIGRGAEGTSCCEVFSLENHPL